MYQVKRPSRSTFLAIRTLQYHVRIWGEPGPEKTPLILLHGWMDVAASYQFMVDALGSQHYIVAPDWRGFGLSSSDGADCFWFPDYLGDLDALMDHLAPECPVNLVGHSMGANVAMLYAGIRAGRVRRLVNLEGFGMPATQAEQAPGRYAQWLNQLKQARAGQRNLRSYDTLQAVADRLMHNNPRLTQDKALWLAGHWSIERQPGLWTILGEPAHKLSSAQLYRVDETLAVHRQITAPSLMVQAADDNLSHWWGDSFGQSEHLERLKAVPNLRVVKLPECGHMLHHDQPERLAELIEDFLA